MRIRQTVAFGLAVVFAGGMIMQPALGADSGSIAGTARKEAKKPFTDYSVRARNVGQGTIAATVKLDTQGNFTMASIDPAKYLVELLDSQGKVVCTEGPFDLSKQASKTGVNIECGKPAAWWLLAAAGAAGITAGVVSGDPASGSR